MLQREDRNIERAFIEHDKELEKIHQSMEPPREGIAQLDENGQPIAKDKGPTLREHKENYQRFYQKYKQDQKDGKWSY